MKNKILSLIAASALLASSTLPAVAVDSGGSVGDHRNASFVVPFVYSLMVSNKTLGVSNLLTSVAISGIAGYAPTNAVGVVFTNFNTGPLAALTTNNIGQGVFVTNGVYDTVNLFQDVDIPSPVGAFGSVYYVGTNGPGVASALQPFQPSGAAIEIEIVGTNAAANSAVGFIFSPLFDGTNELTSTSADQFIVGVTANGATRVCIATNVPLFQWPGAKKLRLRAIFNGDVDASSNVFVKQCRFVRWVQ